MARTAMVCLGRIVAAHGVRGEVGIETYTEVPEEIAAYGELCDESATHTFAITHLRDGPKGLLAQLDGVRDRTAAEALKGTRLYVPRERLPRVREKDTYYQADLIGLIAERADGSPLGRVLAVHNFGAGDLLEVALPGRPDTVLVPFTTAVVPTVDLKAGRVVVDPPPGLLDEKADG